MKSEAKNLDNTDLVYIQIDNWFSHHSPDSDQLERYELIRKTAKVMANVMVKTIPPCANFSPPRAPRDSHGGQRGDCVQRIQ